MRAALSSNQCSDMSLKEILSFFIQNYLGQDGKIQHIFALNGPSSIFVITENLFFFHIGGFVSFWFPGDK